METSIPVIDDAETLRSAVARARADGARIGLVPTMGSLHEGHTSLLRLARERSDFVVVSIYVNPTQFSPGEDLETYPRDLESDLELLKPLRVGAVFAPGNDVMYPRGFDTQVCVDRLSRRLCGLSRPTHFGGVATIVAKLFNLVAPDLAVFGEKDYQQLLVIRQMARDLNFPVEIVSGPTVREPDGLALSSRNQYLSPTERAASMALYRAMCGARRELDRGNRNGPALVELVRRAIEKHQELKVDYVELVHPEDLRPLSDERAIEGACHMAVAVFAGQTRLIDNLRLSD